MKKEIHERAMAKIGELRHLNHYKEADEMMRTSCCVHLQLLNLEGVKEQGIDSYYNLGDVLISSAEDFGDRRDKQESYESWNVRTKNNLQELYKNPDSSVIVNLVADFADSQMPFYAQKIFTDKEEYDKSGLYVHFNDLDGTYLYFTQPKWR